MYVYVCMYMCVCMYIYVYVVMCMRTCTCTLYVYVFNSEPPIPRFEERHGSVVKSRAQSLVIGAPCIE